MKLYESKLTHLNYFMAITLTLERVRHREIFKLDGVVHKSIPVCYQKIFYKLGIKTYKGQYQIGSEL